MLVSFFIAGFFATLAAFYALIPFARRAGYVDRPGGRKHHVGQTPLIGGLVILPFAILLLLLTGLFDDRMAVLFAAVAVIFLMGAYDDLKQINPGIKFSVQVAVASYLVLLGGADVRVLGNIFGTGEVGLNIAAVPFSIAALVLFMNALNMMDGLDGLAGGIAAVILGWLAFAASTAGNGAAALQILCILMPLLAFLALNLRHPFLKKARVFLGDAGSLALGVIIGWFCIDLAQQPGQSIAPVAVMWLLAIPVIDTLTVFCLRVLRKRHPFAPDRNHVHHRFLDKGLSPEWTTPFILLAAVACGAIGLQGLAVGVPDYILFAAWWGVLGAYLAYSLRPGADRQF